MWCKVHIVQGHHAKGSGSKNPKDAIHYPPIIDAGNAPWFVGQERLDHAPFEISQVISVHADSESGLL
jgi:hypothetical protein